ncbi:hypothetical protein JDV09_20575 [Mycobacterium sp. Y57]|uniref:hypothetical protein n=1 Tax=Mycolicibacterium xanthum TaxID=2796469 RepID=UPI001C861EED|nr:hypothetical protein [Mycolicibacterium xanthum]MBX7434476.1 hypothetical protein [Mycolicibacterium xanthum]
MTCHRVLRSHTRAPAAAATGILLLLLAAPAARAVPDTDSGGYVDSTARCTSPDTVVVFGSTGTSRVAICRSPDGDYEYRGVRVRDGARLILPASRSSDGAYTASNDGIEYMVTSSALVISSGHRVIRDEKMIDFHTAGTASGTTGAPAATSTPTTPLPPPLPAEEGGDGS